MVMAPSRKKTISATSEQAWDNSSTAISELGACEGEMEEEGEEGKRGRGHGSAFCQKVSGHYDFNHIMMFVGCDA